MLKIKIVKQKEQSLEKINEYLETNLFLVNKLFNGYKTDKYIYFKNPSEDKKIWSRADKTKIELEIKKIKEKRSPYKILMSLEKEVVPEVSLEDFRKFIHKFLEKNMGVNWVFLMNVYMAMEVGKSTVNINTLNEKEEKFAEVFNKKRTKEEQREYFIDFLANKQTEYVKEEVDKIFEELFKDIKLFRKRKFFFEDLIKMEGNYLLRHFEIIVFEKIMNMKWKKK